MAKIHHIPAELEEITKELVSRQAPLNKSTARDLFNRHKLSLETVAQNMNYLLTTGEESTKYKILQDLLKIHGALEEPAESKSVSISFNFSPRQNGEADPAAKLQILIPRT